MTDSQIIDVSAADWHATGLSVPRETLLPGLERGKVLHFAHLPFHLEDSERRLLDPALADSTRKNISLGADSGALLGVQGDAATQDAVRALVARYQAQAGTLVEALFPEYVGHLLMQPTSLRLNRVETRHTSWRKDDSRLHVDAFPSRPNRGARILRVFTNVNPAGEARVWRIGEPFEAVCRRFMPRIRAPLAGSAWLMHTLGLTKTRRTRYDHLMLSLHDAMKADLAYQRDGQQQNQPFAPGSVWICFSDQTSHAVMSGQFMLEQTFFLPVQAMKQPECAPLGILERLAGRALV